MKKGLILAALLACYSPAFAGIVCGRVTCDGAPLAGVAVSDGISIVLTGPDGRYSIDSDKREGSVFVITPSGYVARSIDGLRPGFWQQLHLGAEFEEVHDFVLEKQDQSRYSVIFLADMHLSNDPARADLNRFRDEVMPVIRRQAAAAPGTVYTINLGDTTHDIYWGEFNFNETDALAAEIARALALRYNITLIYCFEKKGVLLNTDDPDSVVAELRRTRYKAMREMDIIKDWFVNKIDNAFSAIEHGVKEVIITCPSQLANPDKGTHIKP